MTAQFVNAAQKSRSFQATDLAYVAVFAALIAAASLMPAIPVGGLGVPITLQTLALSITALVIGPWRGAAAVLLYLGVGTAGLPVFAGGKAGLGIWFGPTAGYLVAFVFATIAVGFVTCAFLRNGLGKLTWLWMWVTLIVCRILIMYPLATAGIARAAGKRFMDVIAVDLAYWPGDLLKSAVAVLVAVAVIKAFPGLLRR